MRTLDDQITGLHEIGQRLMAAGCNAALVIQPGDVPAITTATGIEVVYAAGGYDVWQDGHLTRTDLTAEQAAQHLIDAYRANPWPIKPPEQEN